MKFSLHGWVEGLSGKHRFSKPNNQFSFGKKSESSSNASQRDNTGKDCAVRGSSKSTESTSISTGDGGVQHGLDDISTNATKPTSNSDGNGAIDHCLDKRVVSQDNEDSGSSHLVPRNTAVDPSHKVVVSQGCAHKDNVLPQIKWGDLDEGTLKHYGKASGAEFEFGGVKNRNLVPEKVDVAAECLPCAVPLDPDKTKFVKDHCLPESHSSSPMTISVEETTNEANEVSLEDVKEQITSEKIVSRSASISGSNVEHEHLEPDNEATYDPSGENVACLDDNKIERIKSAHVSVVPLMDLATSSRTIFSAPTEGSSNQTSKANSDGLPDAQNADVVTSDDVGESKERFRERLWCFLFENLNRAVDELYLLCELECDLEQMKEASLVLEEAALDFRELNSRVDSFEKSKRSSSHGADGGPLVMQSDHRRPHALSWEVSFPAHLDSKYPVI